MGKLFFIIGLFVFACPAFAQFERAGKLREGTTKEMLQERIVHDLDFIQPSPHDTIADIGSYDGYYPLLYSVFSDSVVFYLNDISATGFTAFDSLRLRCEQISDKKINSTFYFTMGTDSTTNLGFTRFNKIVIRDALHHFEKKEKILTELKTKLKPGGKIILFEQIVPVGRVNESLCQGAMSMEEFKGLMSAHGFEMSRSFEGKNDHWWFVFQRK